MENNILDKIFEDLKNLKKKKQKLLLNKVWFGVAILPFLYADFKEILSIKKTDISIINTTNMGIVLIYKTYLKTYTVYIKNNVKIYKELLDYLLIDNEDEYIFKQKELEYSNQLKILRKRTNNSLSDYIKLETDETILTRINEIHRKNTELFRLL